MHAMNHKHEAWMRLAIEEAEFARGATGDNPWVGCAIVSERGELLGRGHTFGPGEDHAEIAAARDAQACGHDVVGATLTRLLSRAPSTAVHPHVQDLLLNEALPAL
jgi:diaminohydroxyphosphoribosylaminopyrimidine deaminase/5-amino-6-(5-phosphoribosylamino)uracil reductase